MLIARFILSHQPFGLAHGIFIILLIEFCTFLHSNYFSDLVYDDDICSVIQLHSFSVFHRLNQNSTQRILPHRFHCREFVRCYKLSC